MPRPPVAKVALIGTPSAGKSTLFSKLTGIDYDKVVSAPEKPVRANVPVRDARLLEINEKIVRAPKLVYPTVELYDTAPFYTDERSRAENTATFSVIRELDAYYVVLEAYSAVQTRDGILRKIEDVKAELFFSDLDIMKKRIEKLEGLMRHPKRTDEDRRELETLQQLFDAVSGGKTEAFRKLTPDDQKRLRGFQFFSNKTMIWLANVSDGDLAKFQGETEFVPLCASLELELSKMSPEERQEFQSAYGIRELVTDTLLLKTYSLLGFQTFFTIGEDEAAGWGIRAGTTALDAAGKIHTDIQRGFIAAEVVAYEDLMKYGSLNAAKSSSKMRMEGKNYVVKDGEIVHFKFSV